MAKPGDRSPGPETLTQLDPPFGSYALPAPVEWFRGCARHLPFNKAGRLLTSLVRRICLAGREGPFDIKVFGTVKARVYPRTNRCEKRVMAGPQFFDLAEREALSEAVSGSSSDPFVFLDLGANVGFYGLWVVDQARRNGRSASVVAVEPDEVTRDRLEANIAASDASDAFIVESCGIGETPGTANMIRDGRNRGANRIDLDGQGDGGHFEVIPITDLCARHGITRVDALKIDIEGHDLPALRGLFASGKTGIFPKLIVVEVGKGEAYPPLATLCEENGYTPVRRTRLNMILRRP